MQTCKWYAQTNTVDVGGVKFAYRELGQDTSVPVIFLNHLGAVLDNWDPRIIDGIAAKHRIITFDNRGIGASEGTTPDSVAAMARDAVAFIRALGFDQVDLIGFSLGGFVAQLIAQEEPQLVRKIVLAGTGPAGGKGIDKVTSVTIRDLIKGALTFKDPKYHLFFTRTSRAGKQRDDSWNDCRNVPTIAIKRFPSRPFLLSLSQWNRRRTKRPSSARSPRASQWADSARRRRSPSSSSWMAAKRKSEVPRQFAPHFTYF